MKRLILLLFVVNLSFSQTYRVQTEYDPLFDVYNSTVTKENSNSPYNTPKYKPEIKPFSPNYQLLNSQLNQLEADYKKELNYTKRNSNIKTADYFNMLGVNKWNEWVKTSSLTYNRKIIILSYYNKAIELNPNLSRTQLNLSWIALNIIYNRPFLQM